MGALKDMADDLYSELGYWFADTKNGENDHGACWGYVGDQEWALAEQYGLYAWDHFSASHEHIPGFPPWDYGFAPQLRDAFYWIEENLGGGGEITMADIINAMYDATPLEFQYFIIYVDAWRAIMWNLPFYVDSHRQAIEWFSK